MSDPVNVPRELLCRVLALSNPSRPAAGAMDRMAEIYGIAREAHRPPLPEISGNPGGLSDHPPECVCTKIPPYDGHSGVVAHYSGPPPIWINAACPVHGHNAAPPAGHDLREKVAEAINRAMIDGQGDQDIIRLATDDILAIPEIAALQAGEGR